MARAGMSNIITELRRMTDADQSDADVNGVLYWTDNQLEGILDQYRTDVVDVALEPVSMMVNGVREWKRYYIPFKVGRFIEDSTTPGAFSIVDTLGVVAPANTVDLLALTVEFTTNTNGLIYYIRCRQYDVRAAASQVWLEKAGHRAQLITWKAGSHNLMEDQEYAHCIEMHQFYGSYRSLGVTRLVRRGYSRWAGRSTWG